LDALMDRTKNRPVPAKRMSPNRGIIAIGLLSILGLVFLYLINPKTAMFGAISIFFYTSIYTTPLKTLTPLSVLLGKFPECPFLLGWVAA
jgi:protoheme IX farnesyltransferase